MMATIGFYQLSNALILFLLIHISILSGPKSVTLALREKRFPSLIVSQLNSIRGGDIIHLKSIEDTESVVAQNSCHDDRLLIIYFSSTDCPPCKKVAPLFLELSEEFEDYGDKIIFCKVNVDENPASASKYQVTGWPTFLFFKKGEKQMEIVGGKLAEATLYDWVKLMAPKERNEDS